MSENASNAAPVSDPSSYIEPLPPRREKSSNLFSDVSGAVEEALAKKQGAAAKPKPKSPNAPITKSERRAAEAEVDELLDDGMGFKGRELDEEDEDDEPAPTRVRRKPEEDDDEEQETEKPARRKPKADAEEPAEGEDETPAEPEIGTKKKPYKRDDMPEDQFVELKVDGEKHVVSMKQLTDDYSGQKAIAQRLAKLGEERATLQRHVDEAKGEVKKNGDFFAALLRDPDRMYEILTRNDEFEATLQKMFERRYNDLDSWQKNPAARAKFLYERGQRNINAQRQQLEQEQQRSQQEQQQRQAELHRKSVLEPGWNDGLRRTGLLNEKNLPEGFVKTAQTWLNTQLGERHATTEDVSNAVVFAAKFHKMRPSNDPPPVRRPIIQPRASSPRAQSARSPSGTKWEDMPRHKRAMDPDFLMRGTKVRG